jgi:hypothetical protein
MRVRGLFPVSFRALRCTLILFIREQPGQWAPVAANRSLIRRFRGWSVPTAIGVIGWLDLTFKVNTWQAVQREKRPWIIFE